MSKQGEIQQRVTESEYAATSATGNATITITNYYYREEAKLVTSDSTDAADESLPCPYRGLFHFGPDDAEFFFGREVFVEKLFAATQSRKFIPVLGASGSGKSSVVLAGLVPKLQKQGYWKFTHFRPGSEPFQALAESLVPLYEPDKNATEQMSQARQLAEYFANGSVPLQDVFSKIKRNYPNHRVLLIVDQFEELYTLCADQKVRRGFLDTLLACFQSDPDNNTVLVGTMRADFLGNLLSYRPLADVLQNADIKLAPMNRDELSQVIEKPAGKLGITFQDGLVERILDDVEDEPGNLPLLEFALTELWKRRTGKQLTHAAYEEIGEVKGALARHADENYGKLSATEKEKVRRIFIQLVHPGEGTEDTRRLATKAELGEASWELVKQLADNRLVVTSQNSANQETVEVVHEALIRNWGELRQWMNADRSFRAWQDRLRSAMYQWKQTQRDEGALLRGAALVEGEEKLKQRREDIGEEENEFIQASVELRDREQKQRERRRRLTFSGLAGGLVLALGLSGLAGIGWGNAEISQINAFAQSSDGFLGLDQQKAVESSVKAAVKMRGQLWGVDANTRTQVKLALLKTIHNVVAPNTLGRHAGEVRGITFSRDGKMLASASADNTVKLWNPITGKEIKTLTGHTDLVNGVSFSPDGKMLASASYDKTVKLWDISTGKEIKTLTGHTRWVKGITFSQDGKMLASASADNTVKLWDTSTGTLIKTLPGHRDSVNDVSFRPDGKMLASASGDKTVKLWDTSTGTLIKTLPGHKKRVFRVSFSQDGKMLASASEDDTVKLWDTNTGTLIKTLTGKWDVMGISFSPDGKMLASASANNTVQLWDTITGKEINSLIGHTGLVWDVSFSPDGKMLATASGDEDMTVKLWNPTGKEIRTLTGHTKEVRDVSFSPNNKILASASADNTVKLWDTSTGILIRNLTGHKGSVNGVSFSQDGKILATASADNKVKLWNTSTGEEIRTLIGHKGSVNGVSFSPDGKLATGSDDTTVKLWDTSTGTLIKTFTEHTGPVNGISFSQDGKMLASASGDTTVKLWDTSTGTLIKTLTGHTGPVNGISFSQDGKMLASASGDTTVKLWDTSTGTLIKTLTGHTSTVLDVSFSPDGMLASASIDRRVKLWDTSTGTLIKTLTGHINSVNGISFSQDGKMLASASADNTVRLWRLDFDYLLQKGCSFMREYYKVNPPNNESDKHLCDGVGNS
ncbi:MAG: hypothetical protein V7K53_16720 [Nostoc sp.]|uniref:nSTAND1 domain-containing NTPase n=1 Tax=Nostoc sp. TaxID=1180 RepID=UPI002FFC90C6